MGCFKARCELKGPYPAPVLGQIEVLNFRELGVYGWVGQERGCDLTSAYICTRETQFEVCPKEQAEFMLVWSKAFAACVENMSMACKRLVRVR